MKGDMVQKKKFLADGSELEGLINMGEYPLEEGVTQIPGQNKIVPVKNGVTTIPPVEATFKITRDSKTLQTLQDWKNDNEYKDCIIITTDGSGAEQYREILPNVECSKISGPAYDASNPAPATVTVTFLPEDVIQIDPE